MLFESAATNWLIWGLILSLLELVVPGTYLIWFGLAGLLMSLLTFFIPMSLTAQIIWFAVFSGIFAFIGWYAYRYIFKTLKAPKEYQNLNDSAQQYVGRTVTVAEDVKDNQTKVQIGDSYWLAYSEKPLKKGATAKVTAVKDSLILVIE
ncbi:MAG: NfeD family protein [Alphaproteobacteria bacterium]|nr:NfeD family protein [Alphaproteobacteria bacterium]